MWRLTHTLSNTRLIIVASAFHTYKILMISSSQQIFDTLTKGLVLQNFDLCVSMLGLYDIYVQSCGGVLEIISLGHVESSSFLTLSSSQITVKIQQNL